MEISVIVDDPAWSALHEPERVVENACSAACVAAGEVDARFEVSIVLGSDDAVAKLNKIWRAKSGPTNVLSFPASVPQSFPTDAIRPLGDIILAYGVVAREAEHQSKNLQAHCSHLVVHGLLHLLGYDHQDDCAAERMEAIEIAALESIGLANPYKEFVTTGHSA